MGYGVCYGAGMWGWDMGLCYGLCYGAWGDAGVPGEGEDQAGVHRWVRAVGMGCGAGLWGWAMGLGYGVCYGVCYGECYGVCYGAGIRGWDMGLL